MRSLPGRRLLQQLTHSRRHGGLRILRSARWSWALWNAEARILRPHIGGSTRMRSENSGECQARHSSSFRNTRIIVKSETCTKVRRDALASIDIEHLLPVDRNGFLDEMSPNHYHVLSIRSAEQRQFFPARSPP